MTLRPYQNEAVAAVEKELSTVRSTLICLVTGGGKTIIFSNIAKNEVQRGGRVLILAHRGELLDQAIDKLYKATGIKAGLEKADETAEVDNEMPPFTVVVGSVQSMSKPKRLARFSPNEFSLIIIDECHHALTNTYRAVIDYFPHTKILGVTATTDRGDLRPLSEVFETIAYEYNIIQGIREKYLSPIAVQTIPLQIDLSSVAKFGGDYQAAGVGSALEPYLQQICEEIKTRCADRKTIIFTPLIATSIKILNIFKSIGIENVREVNGETENRKEITEWFSTAPKGSILLNSMLLTEGYDEPSVDCIVVLRATKVRSLLIQMLGRGTRLCEGKKNLLVLDFLWLTAQHDLCRPACLITDNQELADTITKKQEKMINSELLLDEDTLADAECDVVKKREDALAERLRKQRNKKGMLIDPLEYASKIGTVGISNNYSTLQEEDKPTIQQLEKLEKLGVGCPLSGSTARMLLHQVEERESQGLTSPKQIRLLTGKGFHCVETWKAKDAQKMIAKLAMCGWKTPYGINPKTYKP